MRNWYDARSFLELQKDLENITTTPVETTPEIKESLVALLKRTLESDKNRELGFTAAAILIEKTNCNINWVKEVFQDSEKEDFFWCDFAKFYEMVCSFNVKKLTPILELSLAMKGEEWFAKLMLELPFTLWKNCERTLNEAKLGDQKIIQLVGEKLSNKNTTCDQLIWFWKNPNILDSEKDRLLTHTALFITLTKPVSKHLIKAKKQLMELLTDNDKFLKFIAGNGDERKTQSLLEHLKTYGTRCGIDEKKLLLRLASVLPKSQKNIEKTTAKKQTSTPEINTLITSLRSYTEFQHKLQEIIKEIPQNKEQIQRAREFGDFSENAELDAAKERRNYLLARQTEYTEALKHIRHIDFSDIKIDDCVVLGTTVTLEIEDEGEITYHVLGCWDSLPEKNILSSGAELTQIIFGKKAGESIVLPTGKNAQIKSVEKLDKQIAEFSNTQK